MNNTDRQIQLQFNKLVSDFIEENTKQDDEYDNEMDRHDAIMHIAGLIHEELIDMYDLVIMCQRCDDEIIEDLHAR